MKIWDRLLGAALFWAGTEAEVEVFKGVRYAEKAQRWKPPVPYQGTFEHALENRNRIKVRFLKISIGKESHTF